MIIPFRRAKRALHIERQQDLLAQTVMELFPDRPVTDIELAIGAGSKAIERGTPFFDAMEIAEGIIEMCRVGEPERTEMMEWRNRERLTHYRIKRSAINGE